MREESGMLFLQFNRFPSRDEFLVENWKTATAQLLKSKWQLLPSNKNGIALKNLQN